MPVRKPTPAGRRPTQSRGDERRAKIIEATLSLLNSRDLNEITYSDVGRESGIPLGSMHFFFPDLQSIYRAIWEADNKAICERLEKPLKASQCRTWRSIYYALLDRGIKYMLGNPGVSQLAIGGKTSPALLQRNHQMHNRMAPLFERIIGAHIELPQVRQRTRVFYIAIEIFDLVLTLSMIEYGTLVPQMVAEAKKASAGYLSQYFAEDLPRRRLESTARPAGRAVRS
jgi:AcrR family transcriptional regulator